MDKEIRLIITEGEADDVCAMHYAQKHLHDEI